MARPATLARVGAAQADFDRARAALRHSKRRTARIGEEPDPAVVQWHKEAKAEFVAALAAADAEDEGRTTWGVPENARFYRRKAKP